MKSMRRIFFFSVRCAKEILRDPINLGFGLGFPFVLLLLLSAIQSNVPVSLFEIASLTPGIVVGAFLRPDRFQRPRKRIFAAPLYNAAVRRGISARLFAAFFADRPCAERALLCCGAVPRACVERFDRADDSARAAVRAFVYFYRAFLRQPARLKAGRRGVRRAFDQPQRVAFRHMV